MAKTSALPKFIQLSEMLIREIAAGHLSDGARLPPERDMADDLGVAVGTLRKALADVEAKGLLDRVQGSGNYVRHRPVVDSVYAFFRLELLNGGGLPTADVLSVDRMPKPEDAPSFGPGVASVPDWVSDAFRLKKGETAGYIERVSWTATKQPAEFSRTWYDAKRAAYISRMGKG